MMKRVIAILMAIMLCITLIACSNQPVTQPSSGFSESIASETDDAMSGNNLIENSDSKKDVHSGESTETSTSTQTTATEGTNTSEKEDVTETTATSTPKKDTEQTEPTKESEVTAPPQKTESKETIEEKSNAATTTETTAPTESTTSTDTQPEVTTPTEPPSTQEIESLVAQYINQYRAAQGDTQATVLPGLTQVARYRARLLVSDFSHNSNPNPCTVLQYGEYIDMTLFGGDASESYYRGYNREAIGKGDWFGTADQIAQRIANGFKKSSGHWAYVGDSEYSYMAVGVIHNESDGKWYCCICMSSKNYGD